MVPECHATILVFHATILVFIGARMIELVVTTAATGHAKLQSNQHPTFYRLDALPVTQPTVSRH